METPKRYTNVYRGCRISPSKARPVADLIRGRSLEDAVALLAVSKRRAAYFFKQGLVAAQANADQDDADARLLFVADARVDSGPTMKRFRPKDRGRAHPILKRTSHLTIALAEKPQRQAAAH